MSAETSVPVKWERDVPAERLLSAFMDVDRKGWLSRSGGRVVLLADDGTVIPPGESRPLLVGEHLNFAGAVDLYLVLTEDQLALVEEARRANYPIAEVRSGLVGAPEGESSLARDFRALSWLSSTDGCTPQELGALLTMQPRGVQAWIGQRIRDGLDVQREQDASDKRKVRLRVSKESLRRALDLY
jgi:hypothetical protein